MNFTPINFLEYAAKGIEMALITSNLKDREETFSGIMNYARELNMTESVENLVSQMTENEKTELWELPIPFENQSALAPFPISALPDVLRNYLDAVVKYCQVTPEMAVIPLFSAISLCCQDKAVVKYPGNDHTETLNLYGITIASPGERKSSCLKMFMQPIQEYVKSYNRIHKEEIEQYRAKRAFLENQRAYFEKTTKSKEADLQKVLEITKELTQLEADAKHELLLNVDDATPEALATFMHSQGGSMGLITDEATPFKIIGGLYSSSGKTNTGIFLKSYSGEPLTIIRQQRESMTLENPLLTIGIMVQPQPFDDAMQNPEFLGNGLIHRFLFSFPGSKLGYQSFTSENIPENIKTDYNTLIETLLKAPNTEFNPTIYCDKEAFQLFSDYHTHLQEDVRPGRAFEYMKEWTSKQFARCLKIAALLTICENGNFTSKITGKQTANAINISMWFENQAIRAFSGSAADSPDIARAKELIKKFRRKKESQYKISELQQMRIGTKAELEEPLQMLADMNYIRIIEIKNGNRKPSCTIKVNPILLQD